MQQESNIPGASCSSALITIMVPVARFIRNWRSVRKPSSVPWRKISRKAAKKHGTGILKNRL